MKLWPSKPKTAPSAADSTPPEQEDTTPVTSPQMDAQHALEAATGEHENSLIHAERLHAALLDGDPTVTPADIDAAETRVRHAALAREAAKAALTRAFEKAAIDAWPAIREERVGEILDAPEIQLAAALDELAPRVRAALEDLESALAEVTAPVIRHNGAVHALAAYVGQGGYTDPDDRVTIFGALTSRPSVTVAGRGGQIFDAGEAVDLWLASLLPTERIAEWLERARIAKLNRGL